MKNMRKNLKVLLLAAIMTILVTILLVGVIAESANAGATAVPQPTGCAASWAVKPISTAPPRTARATKSGVKSFV